MYRGQRVVFNQLAADNDGVFKVVPAPWHESGNQVLTQGEFAVLDRHTFDQDITLLDFITGANHNLLVDAGTFVGADKVLWFVADITIFILDDNFAAGSANDFTVIF